MLAKVRAGALTLEGYSLGGVYTTIAVPELGALFDVGLGLRAYVGYDHLFLSHAHADHVGGLVAWLGLRGLHGRPRAKLYCHPEVVGSLRAMLEAATLLQRYDLGVDFVPMEPGDVVAYRKDVFVRAFRTYHGVPSLGFELFRRVDKLKAAYAGMPGPEIARRKALGEPLFDTVERSELAYATDTLAKFLRDTPHVAKSKVLLMECTFVDDRKSRADSRAGCHVHLDDLLDEDFGIEAEHVVFMHASQLYQPAEYERIVHARAPASFRDRVSAFVPPSRHWPL